MKIYFDTKTEHSFGKKIEIEGVNIKDIAMQSIPILLDTYTGYARRDRYISCVTAQYSDGIFGGQGGLRIKYVLNERHSEGGLLLPLSCELWGICNKSEMDTLDIVNINLTGFKIAQKRAENSISQQKLAEKIGVTQKDISRWETGKFTPKSDKLLLIADALQCDITDLI